MEFLKVLGRIPHLGKLYYVNVDNCDDVRSNSTDPGFRRGRRLVATEWNESKTKRPMHMKMCTMGKIISSR
jgi:hypothetical protein